MNFMTHMMVSTDEGFNYEDCNHNNLNHDLAAGNSADHPDISGAILSSGQDRNRQPGMQGHDGLAFLGEVKEQWF